MHHRRRSGQQPIERLRGQLITADIKLCRQREHVYWDVLVLMTVDMALVVVGETQMAFLGPDLQKNVLMRAAVTAGTIDGNSGFLVFPLEERLTVGVKLEPE